MKIKFFLNRETEDTPENKTKLAEINKLAAARLAARANG